MDIPLYLFYTPSSSKAYTRPGHWCEGWQPWWMFIINLHMNPSKKTTGSRESLWPRASRLSLSSSHPFWFSCVDGIESHQTIFWHTHTREHQWLVRCFFYPRARSTTREPPLTVTLQPGFWTNTSIDLIKFSTRCHIITNTNSSTSQTWSSNDAQ